MRLNELTITEASKKLANNEITSVELTEAVFDRIEAVESKVGSYITLTKDLALKQAKESDQRRKVDKTLSKFDGIPIAVKDLFLTKGVRTTAASKILDDFIPSYESTVTKKLWQAGAVLIGKTNLDEFALGSSTETSAYKTAPVPQNPTDEVEFEGSTTRNPWDLTRVPGGSSGGSAAAVAADECIGALGTDTGGSIRQPASFCGITGLKPTYGRVSRYGTIAMASSLDQAGPMAKTVEDAAMLLSIMSGFDKYDSTSSDREVPDYDGELRIKNKELRDIKVGVPAEFLGEGVDEDVEQVVRGGVEQLKKMGAKIVPVSLPMAKYALVVYYILMPAEVSSNLARYDGVRFGHSILKARVTSSGYGNEARIGNVERSRNLLASDDTGPDVINTGSRSEHRDLVTNKRSTILDVYKQSRAEGFGAEAKRRIMLGSYVLSAGYYDAYYRKALKVRTLIKNDFEQIFKKVDVLAAPVSPTPAFQFGEKSASPLSMYMSDILTVPANPAGLPALSLPAGFVKRGGNDLPVGMQLIGPMWSEPTLLGIGHAFQQETDWHLRKPAL